MTELGKLIDSASRANHGRSMQAAADLATRLGAPISKSHISKNARQAVSLTPQLVRGIAVGYGLAEEDVIRAVLDDLGFAISDYNPSVESQIRRDPELSAEAKTILLAGVAAARSVEDGPVRRRVQRADQSQEPLAPSGHFEVGEPAGDARPPMEGFITSQG